MFAQIDSTFSRILSTPVKTRGFDQFFNIQSVFGTKKATKTTALNLSAFWCGVNTISNSIALLPFDLIEKQNGTITRLTSENLHYLVHTRPSDRMSAFNFKFMLALSAIIKGNGLAIVERDGRGLPVSLNFVNWDDAEVTETEGRVFYKVKSQIFSQEEVLHIIYHPDATGLVGKGVVDFAAENLGVQLAAQEYSHSNYTNKGLSHGVLETDIDVAPQTKRLIEAAFSEKMSSDNKHKIAVLDEGFKYKPITLTPEQAQFVETQAIGVQDVARWLQIPLHKLHLPGEGGFNFLVQMSIEYLQTAVMPFGQKFKEEFDNKLLTRRDRDRGRSFQLNYNKLLQADPESRARFYKDLVYIKAMNPNEVRELENMNPYVGGEQFLQMANLLNEDQLKNLTKNEKL